MATLSTSALNYLADEWEKLYPSAVLSGIVGDLAHKARGGYHISRQDQGSSNYSVTRADDKLGPSDRASAIDMTMSTADMTKCHKRIREAWLKRSTDPRIKYINAWNGWDGQGDAGRYDVITGSISTATPDHKWHIHLELRRRYVNDMTAMRAILSILKGETLAQYQGLTANPAKPVDIEKEEEYMPLTDADVKKIWDVDYLPSGFSDNPTWAAKTLIAYRLNNIHTQVDRVFANLNNLTKTVVALEAKVGNVDINEAEIANAIAGNPAYIDSLAAAIVAKLPEDVTPEQLTTAIKVALREGVAK